MPKADYERIFPNKKEAYRLFEIWLKTKDWYDYARDKMLKHDAANISVAFGFFLKTPIDELKVIKEFTLDTQQATRGSLDKGVNPWVKRLFEIGFMPEVTIKKNPSSTGESDFKKYKIFPDKKAAYDIFEEWLTAPNKKEYLKSITKTDHDSIALNKVFNFFVTVSEKEIKPLRTLYADKPIASSGPFNPVENLWLRKLFTLGFKPEIIVKRNPMTKDAKDFISKKISQLIHEGYEISQAIAIAYSEARDRGFHVPDYEKENPSSFIEKAALKKIRDVALEISKKYKKIEFTNISVESGTNPETNEEEKFIRIEGSYLDGKGFAISQFGLDEVLQTPFDDLLAHYSNEILKELKETVTDEDINSPEFIDRIDSIIDKITSLYNRSTLLNDFKKGDDYIRSKLDRDHKVNLLKKDIPILSARIAEEFIEVRGIAPEDQFDQFSMNQECVFIKARDNEYTILEFPKPFKDMPEKYEIPIEFFVYMIFFECVEAFRKRPDLFHLKLSE